MSRTYRRSVNAEAIAPWVTLSIILLMWWCGAKTVAWLRPRLLGPTTVTTSEPAAPPRDRAKPVDSDPKDTAVGSNGPSDEPGLTADVKVTGVDIATLRTRQLLIPVKGIEASALVSSFADARTGHQHEAIDILAPRGTDVMAVEDGTIAKLFTSKAGGLTIYEFDPSKQFVYYYAHLDGYAPGLKEGQEVKRGDVLGYVGTTGNAPKDTPHLHFGISKLDPDRRWWGGTALDPFLVWR